MYKLPHELPKDFAHCIFAAGRAFMAAQEKDLGS